jgi:hypothetical protein
MLKVGHFGKQIRNIWELEPILREMRACYIASRRTGIGEIEVRRQGRRRKQLVYDLKEMRGY